MATRVISFHYTLTDKAGKILDSSNGREALSFMEGIGQIIPGLEKALEILNKGDKKKIHVTAAEAYGLRDEDKVIKITPEQLPSKDIKVGDRFSAGEEDDHSQIFVVTQLTETEVILDGNHSLAGMDLIFDVELTDVRNATAEEISHGHAHGVHGHSH